MSSIPKSMRLCRLNEILSGAKPYLTIREIAKELHVTERTVYRDIVHLEQYGIPVINDRGYRVYTQIQLNINQLTEWDYQTIDAIFESSPFMRLPNMKKRCQSILDKLHSQMLPLNHENFPSESYQPADRPSPSEFKFNFRQLEKAIQQQKIIKMIYQALDEEEPLPRQVHPYVMAVRKSNWYLIGFSERNEAIHLYRLERIRDIQVTNTSFNRNDSFDLDQYFDSVWGVFRDESFQAELRLSGIAIRLASEQTWPEETEFLEQKDGTQIVKMKARGKTEFLAWILSQSPHVEILKPKALRDELKQLLKEMLKLHTR